MGHRELQMKPFTLFDPDGTPYLAYRIVLEGASFDAYFYKLSSLTAVSAKQLKRLGAPIVRPHEALSYRGFGEPTYLGAGLIAFAAYTIAVLSDERFFQTGRLLDFGQYLASSSESRTWNAFVRSKFPDLYGRATLSIELSEIVSGSLTWQQKFVLTLSGVSATIGILNGAPELLAKWDPVYKPLVEQATKASAEFLAEYFAGLHDIAEVTITPASPQVPMPPGGSKRKRRVQVNG